MKSERVEFWVGLEITHFGEMVNNVAINMATSVYVRYTIVKKKLREPVSEPFCLLNKRSTSLNGAIEERQEAQRYPCMMRNKMTTEK